MKTIKLYIMAAVALATGLFAACTDYQDEVDALDTRVTILENLVQRVNSDIAALQTVIDAAEAGDVITRVDPYSDGQDTGYKIYFLKHDPILVLNGRQGEAATTPKITCEKDPSNPADDNYYWKLNGEWVTDDQGNKLVSVGKSGEDGAPGNTPQLRIENGIWQVSYDNGKTWSDIIDPATQKPMSVKGTDGDSPDPCFKDVQVSLGGGTDGVKSVTFVTNNDVTFTINLLIFPTEVRIKRNGVYITKATINKEESIILEAEVLPEKTIYKDVFWYVKSGNASNVTFGDSSQPNTTLSISQPGIYVIGAVARFSEPRTTNLIGSECEITVY